MRKYFLLLVLYTLAGQCWLMGQSRYRVSYRPLQSGSIIQDKAFYLLTALSLQPGLKTILRQHPALRQLGQEKARRLSEAVTKGSEFAADYMDVLRWSATETTTAGQALVSLYGHEPALKRLVQEHLRPSGYYERWVSLPDTALLLRAWQSTADGLNQVLDVYGLGKKPRYPAIDSVSYDARSLSYRKLIRITASVSMASDSIPDLFFSPTLSMALALLDINNRDEAARFEPMQQGENKAAFARIGQTRWADYPYSAIVVLGAGPDIPNSGIDGWGKMRLRLAVERFKSRKAPFLIVSGGNVHPFQTPFNEALEMKKVLMKDYQIPESAILLEPHARHTTTNLRNASRLLYRYGVPVDKPVLITTDMYQSRYIESALFAERCHQELGYILIKSFNRLTSFDLSYQLMVDSLSVDSNDPLDP